MNMRERRAWDSFLRELLKEKNESAAISEIREDLCSQILNMSKSELFELCQDLESIPCRLEKPARAMDCETCRKVYGACTGQYSDVDFDICEERFWNYAEKQRESVSEVI